MANATKIVQKSFNSGYAASLHDKACRERYAQTLNLLSGTNALINGTPHPPLGLGGGKVGDCHLYDLLTPTYGASVGHTLPHFSPSYSLLLSQLLMQAPILLTRIK